MAKSSPIIQDFLPAVEMWPGEVKEEFQILHDALMQDLAPCSAYQEILAFNLIQLEWETVRFIRLRNAFLMPGFGDPVDFWGNQDEDDYSDKDEGKEEGPKLEELNITDIARAYENHQEIINTLEFRIAEIEVRRRRLLEDYRRLKNIKLQPIEDAEIVEET